MSHLLEVGLDFRVLDLLRDAADEDLRDGLARFRRVSSLLRGRALRLDLEDKRAR